MKILRNFDSHKMQNLVPMYELPITLPTCLVFTFYLLMTFLQNMHKNETWIHVKLHQPIRCYDQCESFFILFFELIKVLKNNLLLKSWSHCDFNSFSTPPTQSQTSQDAPIVVLCLLTFNLSVIKACTKKHFLRPGLRWFAKI